MAVLLLIVGAGSGSVLPKAGAWMESVKTAFGVLLLACRRWPRP
ncbi:protein-disulfide reductase [Alcaligenes faecalis subsp. faecalis NCIB 8687]|nr:protein-disulfide reductase [Alcaligenes faecalis subsp. faecalis NCIB 8687]